MEPHDMIDAVSASMRERTGRTVDEWVDQVEADGVDPLDQRAVRAHLKAVHGIAQNGAWAVADAAARRHGWTPPTLAEVTDALYSGSRAALRPLHDAVVDLARSLGDDVEVQARGTYVPVVARTQLAAVAPGPRGTLRVGLRYRDHVPDDPRLAPARSFAQATHWVHLAPDDDPASLAPLLRAAYDQNR